MNAVVERLASRVESLASLSEPGAGVSRPSWSKLESEAHRLVASWVTDAGVRAERDEGGNTTLIFAEGEPYLGIGSHLDSVPGGGRYDGVIGVLAALEAAVELAPDIDLGLRVIIFAAEEGARFGRPCLGSALATGDATAAELPPAAVAAAESIGLDPSSCPAWAAEPELAAFLEVHIEQARRLELEGVGVGIVDVVAGASRQGIRIKGRAEHSGAAPMAGRADALAAAAEIVLEVERAGRDSHDGVATVGKLEVHPNAITTVPGQVSAVIDVRAVDELDQRAMLERIREAAIEIAAARELEIELDEPIWQDPTMLSAWPRRALADACAELEEPFRIMRSGAGHDAAVVARHAPAAMLFVPTPGGVSHSPDEDCRLEDAARGARVVARALRILDQQARSSAAKEARHADN